MKRALALALSLLAFGVAPAGAADRWHTWAGTSGDDAGHGVVSRGEAIWTNYLYDDYGANVDGFQSMDPDLLIEILSPHAYPGDPAHPVGFAPSGNVGRFRHTGDYGYPPDESYPQDPANDPFGDNAGFQNVANVAEVRVAVEAGQVYFHFALTDLRPNSTVIGLAIDTDPGKPGGGGAWPFGASLSSSGWKRFLTVWGSGGALSTPVAGNTDLGAAGGAVREDLDANTIDVRVPLAAIAPGGGRQWRLVAGTGRWDPATKAWAVPDPSTTQTTSPGSLQTFPRVYELPFHHDEPNSLWNETKQANDLAAGSVDSDDWTIDLDQLERGATVPVPCTSGPHELSFLADGTAPATQEGLAALPTQNGGAANLHNVNYIYKWHRQPLAVMLPPSSCDTSAPAPSLDYFFHPANVNQNAWLVGVEGDHDRVNYLHDPPLDFSHVTDLAKRYNRITAGGLGRTEGWNYGDAPGEEAADWAAFQATTQRYRYDPDHVRVGGMSGRLGAPFFAETWPDRVSSLYTVSAHTADSPRVENLRNTPWVFMHGTSFLELQSDLPSYDVLDTHLDKLGYQYLHMTWNGRGHDFGLVNRSYALIEPWTKAARIHPARITYAIDPKAKRPGVPLFPGVDWIPSLALGDPKAPARIDLTDLALARRLPVRQTRFSCSFTNVGTSDDLDYHGLSYDTPAQLAKRMPDVVEPGWTSDGCTFKVTALHHPAVATALTGELENVASLTLDLRGMGVNPARSLDLSGVKTATPVRLRLAAPLGTRTVALPHPGCVPPTVLRFKLRHPRGTRAVAATVLVNGNVRARRRGHSLRRTSILRPARRAFKVVVVTRLASGRTIRSERRYDGCRKSRPRITK